MAAPAPSHLWRHLWRHPALTRWCGGRRGGGRGGAALWACVVLAVVVACTAAAAADDTPLSSVSPVNVMALSFEEGAKGESASAALGETVAAVVRARGVPARLVPAAAVCGEGAGAAGSCVRRALAGLARGELAVAVLPAARLPPAPALRDAGLEELGDAAPPARRSCRLSRTAPAAAPLRSMLDLADATRAALYALPVDDLRVALAAIDASHHVPRFYCANGTIVSAPKSCSENNFATILTESEGEAEVIAGVVREHALLAHVAALGAPAAAAAAALARAAVLCGRALPSAGAGPALGPPPCLAALCPFDPQRLVKLVNVRSLARAPSVLRALGRFELSAEEADELARRAAAAGPARAASEALAAHPAWRGPPPEVRVAVMLPAATRREAYDAAALRAAAELAELDAAEESLETDFKVELLADGCAPTRAFKYLTDALGSEFGALSAVMGPACGGAFGDVTRQSPALALPVVAYTPQAPPPGEAASLTLLAGGDARRATLAWAALFAEFGWRRVAVLSELATRASLDVSRLGADVVVHVELPDDDERIDYSLIEQWAGRVAAADGRIIYVCAEDGRVVRAALCAGVAAGLAGRGAGDAAVWLLPATAPRGWLRRAPGDLHNCTSEQLAAAAEGHLIVAPQWAAAEVDAAWGARVAARCPSCAGGAPAPHAALLYDALRLWAAALGRLARAAPLALDDLHRDDLVRTLLEDVTTTKYVGLTGEWRWKEKARDSALVMQQWRNGSRVAVGAWRDGRLQLAAGEPRWARGAAPDDGGERCALRPLADALHVECRAAFAAVGALALAALLTALAALAWHCRRRAEREFRARLVALDMRTLGPKFGGLDRWEVPRERVVINRKLGTGAFGTVYGGHALLAEDRGWTAVAVKTLKAGATTEEKLDFLSEAEAMKRFEHKNVVRLLGVVTKTEPVCTVMEYMLYGDLKGYLVARRHLAGAGGAGGAEVAPARLTAMALDVARALSYLAQLRYVHRDVAARNCLVSANRVVKLADFGMTRLVFENDYYRFSRKGMLPVRWMAPESLALGVFSPASDVWSFGVLLYEIVTFGSLPFRGLGNAEVLERVKAGRTLELPRGLKPQLEGLIRSCWQRERRARPRAAAVAAFLAESPRLLAPCLDAPLALDALPLAATAPAPAPPTPTSPTDSEARWASWAAPGTDSSYLSAEPDPPAPRDTDAFLPPPSPSSSSSSSSPPAPPSLP